MAEKSHVSARIRQLSCFHLLIGGALLPQMQLDDLDVLRPVEDSPGEKLLHQDANTSEENAEDDGDEKNDSDERKHAEDQVSDIVALAHRGRFVPRDLGFVVHGIKKLLRFAAPDRSRYDVNQRSSASDKQRHRAGLRAA